MSDQALIVRDDSALSISFTEAAEHLKFVALQDAALIGKVANAGEQESAVAAQVALKTLINTVEKARKEAKAPVLAYGQKIDDTAKAFVKDISDEMMRISLLVGDYQALEAAKAQAAQKAENERLAALEREKNAELAKAETHDQLDSIQEKFNERARSESVAVAPNRVEGQRVTEDWDIAVSDIWALARAHPGMVKIEPRLSEIKAALKAGVKVAGITARPIVKATVRAQRQPQAIEV